MSECISEPRPKRIKLDRENAEIGPNLDANQVARLCYNAYTQLGKSGKPNVNSEHTVLSCIVESDKIEARVVALATGTKCFPQNVDTRHEDIVDCHAESLLKRAFKCYLIDLIDQWLTCDKPIDQFYSEILERRQYYLFVSKTPCGCLSRWKGVGEQSTLQLQSEELKTYKEVGVNRKPGRGDLCPKAGCVHKIAKWTILGLQGRTLLPLIGRAVTLHAIVVGNCEEAHSEFRDEEIIARLQLDQTELNSVKDQLKRPEIFNFDSTPSIEFANEFRYEEFIRTGVSSSSSIKKPTGSSIVAWYKASANWPQRRALLQCEVLASGRKLGASRPAPKKGLSARPNDDTASDVTLALKQANNNKRGTTSASKYHRPVDLEVSDRALNRLVGQLLDRLRQRCISPDTNAEGNDRRVGVPDSTELGSNPKNGAPECDEIQQIYEHNWQLMKRSTSIFKGWPTLE